MPPLRDGVGPAVECSGVGPNWGIFGSLVVPRITRCALYFS